MRTFRICAVVAVMSLAAMPGLRAQTRDENMQTCMGPDAARSIVGCTAIIQSKTETPAERVKALTRRGVRYRAAGDNVKALGDYDEALALAPADGHLYDLRCFTRALLNRLEEALVDCNQALRILPAESNAFDSRGFVFLKLRHFDAAIADFTMSFTLEPRFANPLYERGVAKLLKGDTTGGNADIAVATKQSPGVAAEMAGFGVKP